jgi:hypothetical protein
MSLSPPPAPEQPPQPLSPLHVTRGPASARSSAQQISSLAWPNTPPCTTGLDWHPGHGGKAADGSASEGYSIGSEEDPEDEECLQYRRIGTFHARLPESPPTTSFGGSALGRETSFFAGDSEGLSSTQGRLEQAVCFPMPSDVLWCLLFATISYDPPCVV